MTLFAAQAGVYFDETVRDCKILNDGSLKKNDMRIHRPLINGN